MVKIIYITILKGKKFLNYVWFSSLEFFAASHIVSSANSQRNLKLARKGWLINRGKYTDTNI